PLIVSVMGFEASELETIIDRLEDEPGIAALELNLSCPNVKTGTIVGADAGETAELVGALRGRTNKPLIAKLSPANPLPAAVALAAQEAGVDAVSLVNTFPAMALKPGTNEPWLGATSGGLSGAAIRAVALAQVYAVCKAVSIPVVGMGGIETAQQAREFLGVGATLVAVGTANFADSLAGKRISFGL
ncbi:MAG: hypothetical protein JHC87_02530, partial [Thermoleophilaceae bacterium]|nr:hypothetical protein [Thermoleophilaceae bacterium]